MEARDAVAPERMHDDALQARGDAVGDRGFKRITFAAAREHLVPRLEAGIADGRWHDLKLQPDDVLILAEVMGPRTGVAEDADPAHRAAVRLTAVRHDWDPLHRRLLVHVDWCPEDALPFPLCLSAIEGPPDCELNHNISVAWGNIVAVDHGRSFEDDLGCVAIARTREICAR